jgi:dihydrofolate reductase
MGYTHIVVNGKKWEDFTEAEQTQLIVNFKENVRKLMPQLLVVLGRKTYEALFKGTQPRIKGVMPTGFRPHVIKWHRTAKDCKRGNTKIFLMRKTRFRIMKDKSR